LRALANPDVELRAQAAQALGEIAAPANADVFAGMLGDADDRIRARGAYGLARLGDPRAIEALVRTIDDLEDLEHVAGSLSSYVLAGMGAGLYDAAFSTLGSIYGQNSRGAIAAMTLFGGFASTVCWPLSTLLVEQFGWRGACFFYAAVHAGLSLPTYLMVLPRGSTSTAAPMTASSLPTSMQLASGEGPAFAVLGAIVTIGAAILATMGTHLIQLLQAQGTTLAAAVALGMLIGPSAVGARLVEMTAGRHYHPIWTMAPQWC
jgi:MFS family permease